MPVGSLFSEFRAIEVKMSRALIKRYCQRNFGRVVVVTVIIYLSLQLFVMQPSRGMCY